VDKKILWRIVLILAVVGVAAWSLYPPTETLNLGLDLRGGIHLVLKVETDVAIKAELDDSSRRIVSLAKDKDIELGAPEVEPDQLRFRVPVPADANRDALNELVADYLPEYNVTRTAGEWTFTFEANVQKQVRDRAVRQTLETIRNRVDQFGVSEPVIQRQGLDSDRLLIQLPGVDDPARVKEIISSTALLEFKEVVGGPAPNRESLLQPTGGQLPTGSEILSGTRQQLGGGPTRTDYYLVKKASIISGSELRTARRSQDQYGMAVVSFSVEASSADKFGQYTGSHIGTPMAIVLDDNVVSAPVIRARISDSGIIEGGFDIDEAEDLALKLRAGALPAKVTYLEERTVGPSLGRDSVVRGVRAAVAGLLIVMVFMLVYYKWSGLNADIALVLNVVLLLGAMAYFGATLTLPGIAGVILTIGMAVDANVLIFERIREELAIGKTVRAAIDTGFARAFGTILDANITTFIAALFLFQFGTGPVKGFAVTLSIGIMASVFTAVFVSRTLYMLVLARRDRVETLSI
jgi:preprotein translocase subunit SecD